MNVAVIAAGVTVQLVGVYAFLFELSYMRRSVKWCEAREKLFANLFLAASSQSRLDHPTHRAAITSAGINSGQAWIPSKMGVDMLVQDFRDRVATGNATQQATQMIRDFEMQNPVPKREIFFWKALILDFSTHIPRPARAALPKETGDAAARTSRKRIGPAS